MLALRFTFPAGRFHATPWGRHVNEGEVTWPPEPWRILRAFIATWHHKVTPSVHFDGATLAAMIENLAAAPPGFALPAASHSHTRHYLPQWKAGDTSLVFDAFAAVDRAEPLHCVWPDLDLPEDQVTLLDELLNNLGYLGRAESWVEAQRVDKAPATNCDPGDQVVSQESGEVFGEMVDLLAPLEAGEYRRLRERFLADKKQARKLAATLPARLVDAMRVDNAELQKQGWSQPPAARKVSYVRPREALKPRRSLKSWSPPAQTTARFLLVGKPLPRVEDSLRIGELLRRAVMRQAKHSLGENAVPPMLSGHGMPDDNCHAHAFYLPWDDDSDGRLDHVLIHITAGINRDVRRAIERLSRMWLPGGTEWELVFEGFGEDGGSSEPLTAASTVWHSATPYLHPWHAKKNFAAEDQIRRECRERSLPEPINAKRLTDLRIAGRTRRPIHFHRFRTKRGLLQPDTHGSFWQLKFPVPIQGPLALGFACHFGLGLFLPTGESEGDGPIHPNADRSAG